MNEAQLTRQLPDLLQSHWQLNGPSIAPLGGGMNSATAVVTTETGHLWVAKWVRASGSAAFSFGVEVATRLAAGGMRSGQPLLTVHGQSTVPVGDGSLALLQYVPGNELTGRVRDQPSMAQSLALAHTLLGTSLRHEEFFPWLGDDPRLREVGDWILPTISTVVAEYRALPAVTWGVLHADPSPEAFRADAITGEVGIIDWAGACDGPLLYDVASALMYLGGPVNAATFLQHYAAHSPLPVGEFDRHLDTFRRLRGIVQADYFGRRILNDDLTGIDDPAENHKGLADAHHMLTTLGAI